MDFFFIIMVFIINKKDKYNLDEIFSYGLSNNQINLPFKEGKYSNSKELFYKNYLEVNKKNQDLIIIKYGKIKQKMFIHLFIICFCIQYVHFSLKNSVNGMQEV